ncbi:MAG: enoyl-CoA hydratase/isomerase family protein [Pseudomonadota bacterium]
MDFVSLTKNEGIARIALNRGKVNAINEKVVDELTDCFQALSYDPGVTAVFLTGEGKFFTFGFDIPEFLSYTKEAFIRYLTKFTGLYTDIFLYPKPVVAALNGHTIAGGCMLAIACDYRIMVPGNAKISLNEISFSSSVFAGSVEIMKLLLGQRQAEAALLSGAMYSAEEALRLGLIDRIAAKEDLENEAVKKAHEYAAQDSAALRSIKMLLRRPTAEEMMKREKISILEFIDIWYSEKTWKGLKEKVIHA